MATWQGRMTRATCGNGNGVQLVVDCLLTDYSLFTFSHGAVRIVEDWAGESGLGGIAGSFFSVGVLTCGVSAGSVWDPSITLCRYIDSDELFPKAFWQGKRVLGAK